MLRQSLLTQKSSNISPSLFWIGHLLLCMEPPLTVVSIPIEHLLEKTNFSFVSSYQLKTASGLGMGDQVQLLLSVIWPHLDLCRSYACYHCLFDFIYVPALLFLEGLVSLMSSIPTNAYNLIFSSSIEYSDHWRRNLSAQWYLTHCTLSSCGSLFVHICYK